jgi:hypothetical protein
MVDRTVHVQKRDQSKVAGKRLRTRLFIGAPPPFKGKGGIGADPRADYSRCEIASEAGYRSKVEHAIASISATDFVWFSYESLVTLVTS